MRRNLLRLFLLFVCLLSVALFPISQSARITLIHTSNIYGNVLPYDFALNNYEPKGLVHIASFIERFRYFDNSDVLVIDTGNFLFGSPFGDYFVETGSVENPVLEMMNKAGYDFLVPGTLELSLGKSKLEQLLKKAKANTIAANLVGELQSAMGYQIKTFSNGLKIGVIGVVVPYGNFKYADYINSVRTNLEKLKKESPDLIILATSGGITYDPISGNQIALKSNLNIGDLLIKEFSKDVDVFLLGNQSFVYTGKSKNKVYSLADAEGRSLNEINIYFSKTEGKWKITSINIKNVSLTSYNFYNHYLDAIQPYESKVQQWLSETILKSEWSIGFHKYLCILEDSFLNEIVNKAIINYAKTQMGIWNIFNPNFEGIIEGNITRRDLYSLVGKTTTIKAVQMSGNDIKEILKKNMKYISYDGSKIILAKELVAKPWLYDIFENIFYDVVVNKGELRYLLYNGQPLNEKAMYLVSVPSIRTYGTEPLTKGKVVSDIEVPVQHILFANIKNTIGGDSINKLSDKNRTTSLLMEYVVSAGDTLKRVSYRLNVKEEELLSLNPVIKDPNLLRPGWKLYYYKNYFELVPPIREFFDVK